jgi:hypothetical protein
LVPSLGVSGPPQQAWYLLPIPYIQFHQRLSITT